MSINEDLVYLCGQGLHICNLEGNQPGICLLVIIDVKQGSYCFHVCFFLCFASSLVVMGLYVYVPHSRLHQANYFPSMMLPAALSAVITSLVIYSCCVCSYMAISVVSASRLLLFAIMSLNYNQRQSMKTSVKGFSDAMIEFIC